MPQIVTNYIELHICRRTDDGFEFLLLKRADDAKIYPGIWQMITGTIESHEHTKDTLLRELEEETGLKPEKNLQYSQGEYFLSGDSRQDLHVACFFNDS